jgi:hypothetical protein
MAALKIPKMAVKMERQEPVTVTESVDSTFGLP